jgi:hypothetical protein
MENRHFNLDEQIIPESWIDFRTKILKKSQVEMAEELGIPYADLQKLEQGHWLQLAHERGGVKLLFPMLREMCVVSGQSFMELFPEFLHLEALADSFNEPIDLREYPNSGPGVEELVLSAEEKAGIGELLKTLSSTERAVIVLRFGLFGHEEHTWEGIGQEFNVTRERIRQIEAKALRKLRHPSRALKAKSGGQGIKNHTHEDYGDIPGINRPAALKPGYQDLHSLSDEEIVHYFSNQFKGEITDIIDIYNYDHWYFLGNICSQYDNLPAEIQEQIIIIVKKICTQRWHNKAIFNNPNGEKQYTQQAFKYLEKQLLKAGLVSKK